MRGSALAAALAAMLLIATPAFADSDGYYCTGAGFIAYQFGGAAPQPRPHQLHILRVNADGSTSALAPFTLPDFQVHGMRCHADAVEVAAFDVVHVVHLDRDLAPIDFTLARRSGEWAAITKSLRRISLAPERTIIARDPAGAAVVVETAASDVQRCHGTVTSRIVRLDAAGRELAAGPVLFKGREPRECGD
jgi:hypothetical protein